MLLLCTDTRLLFVTLQLLVLVALIVFVEPGPVFVMVCADATLVNPKPAIVAVITNDEIRRSHVVLPILTSLTPLCNSNYRSAGGANLYIFLLKQHIVAACANFSDGMVGQR